MDHTVPCDPIAARDSVNLMTRRSFLGSAMALSGSRVQGQAIKRPNILFVIADDWGNGHAGVFGCDWISTPNVDRVARQGVILPTALPRIQNVHLAAPVS